jgi:hypothetical protein
MGGSVVLVDDPAGNAMPIELGRHEQADRTCAHHQYLGVGSHQVSFRLAAAPIANHHVAAAKSDDRRRTSAQQNFLWAWRATLRMEEPSQGLEARHGLLR